MEEISTIQMYDKTEILKICKTKEEKQENIAPKIIEKLSSLEIDKKEQQKIKEIIEYEYKNKIATVLQTKASVTEIKEMQKKEKNTGYTDENLKCPVPKFLQQDDEIVVTNAEKGTLVHLCMQKLDLMKKTYTYKEIQQLVDELANKKIITKKQAEAININKIYKFTKSQIWNEMVNAKLIEREKTFYINIPAQEILEENKKINEKLLIQGIIDLYYINQNNELILVDFKTDFVENSNEQILINKYKIQLELYKRALESATKKKVNKVYIYSTYLEKEIQI